MYKWKKHGRIFNPEEHRTEWMKNYAQCTSTLVFENFVRVYFSCRPENDPDGQAKSYLAFIDLDRYNLKNIMNIAQKPVLPLGELGTFDEFAVYPSSVIRHDGKVYLYYAGWSRSKSVPFNTSVGLAISEDNGVSFNRVGPGPILSASLYEPFVISGPKVRKFNNKWFLFYLAGRKWINYKEKKEIVYKIRMATSDDGIVWNRLNQDIISNKLEENEAQAGPDVFFKDGLYHMYFVYRYALDFRDDVSRGYRIGYAQSNDLVNWDRKDENVGVSYSKSGWDSKMAHYPHVFELDGKYFMLYNGNDFGKYGFGLAEMIEK